MHVTAVHENSRRQDRLPNAGSAGSGGYSDERLPRLGNISPVAYEVFLKALNKSLVLHFFDISTRCKCLFTACMRSENWALGTAGASQQFSDESI
jgi:N-acyl-L-homoserine lactone synthetase